MFAPRLTPKVTFFLDETIEIRKLARRILKLTGASDSQSLVMCNNMKLLSSDTSGFFVNKSESPISVNTVKRITENDFKVSSIVYTV